MAGLQREPVLAKRMVHLTGSQAQCKALVDADERQLRAQERQRQHVADNEARMSAQHFHPEAQALVVIRRQHRHDMGNMSQHGVKRQWSQYAHHAHLFTMYILHAG